MFPVTVQTNAYLRKFYVYFFDFFTGILDQDDSEGDNAITDELEKSAHEQIIA